MTLLSIALACMRARTAFGHVHHGCECLRILMEYTMVQFVKKSLWQSKCWLADFQSNLTTSWWLYIVIIKLKVNFNPQYSWLKRPYNINLSFFFCFPVCLFVCYVFVTEVIHFNPISSLSFLPFCNSDIVRRVQIGKN